MAIRPEGTNEGEHFLWGRAGYGRDAGTQKSYLLLCDMSEPPGVIQYDRFAWDNRTLKVAHDYIAAHWETLESGQVIDIEHVLGETREPKLSERFSNKRKVYP